MRAYRRILRGLHIIGKRCNNPPVQPTAKSLVLDLLSSQRSAAMPVRALVAAASLFGIDGNGMRVALARLLAKNVIERDERGVYRLAAGAGAVTGHVRAWRRLEDLVRDWKGAWIAVHAGSLARSGRTSVRRNDRALAFLGFRELEAGLYLRPDNLAGGIEVVRTRLHDLGLARAATLFTMTNLDEAGERRARSLWDVAALRRGYREAAQRLATSTARLSSASTDDAMVETYLLGGDVLRQIVLDPLLPDAIVPGTERRSLIAAMRNYDKLGRACWAPFMRRHGAEASSAPLDVRTLDTAERIPVQAAGGAS
jgi:phenylacetic acid degradation operon negative regulatory protein